LNVWCDYVISHLWAFVYTDGNPKDQEGSSELTPQDTQSFDACAGSKSRRSTEASCQWRQNGPSNTATRKKEIYENGTSVTVMFYSTNVYKR
jgi:hypothetical protein